MQPRIIATNIMTSHCLGALRHLPAMHVPRRERTAIAENIRTTIGPDMVSRLFQQSVRLNDPHIHTTISDGKLSPAAVFDRAVERAVGTIVLTDHDRIGNILQDMMTAAQKGVDYTFGGVELTFFPGGNVTHIKVYFDPFDPDFARMISEHKQANRDLFITQIIATKNLSRSVISSVFNPKKHELPRILRSLGINPSYAHGRIRSALARFRNLDRTGIETLRQNIERRGDIVGALASRGVNIIGHEPQELEIFRQFTYYLALKNLLGCSEVTPIMGDTLKRFADKGAWITFAHPGRNMRYGMSLEEIAGAIGDLKRKGLLHGIETSYSLHTPDQQQLFAIMAENLGVEEDGGSDFHGYGKEDFVELGSGINWNACVDFGLFVKVRRHLIAPLTQMGDECFGLGRFLDGFDYYRKALAIDPYDFETYAKIAHVIEYHF
ncbi:MAG: hypothetical protein WC527_08830 [Candidatus Margulisiibacteriota bacterium]